MPKIKKEHTPFFLTAIILLLDVAIVFFMSLISIRFDFAQLRSPIFWANYCATFVVSQIAYFGTIGTGKKSAQSKQEYTNLLTVLDEKRAVVSNMLLDDKRDAFIDGKNKVEKLKAYLTQIDYSLSVCKDDKKRVALKKEKSATLSALNLATAKVDYAFDSNLTEEDRTRYDEIIAENDFNIDSKKVCYRKIDKRVISAGIHNSAKRDIGGYNEGFLLATDSQIKIVLSIVCAVLTAIILPDSTTPTVGVIFLVTSRLLMIAMNAYSGYTEGYKLISEYKTGAIKEQIAVHNQFINWCEGTGVIKKNRPIPTISMQQGELQRNI